MSDRVATLQQTWQQLFDNFLSVMLRARHDTSWTRGEWGGDGRSGEFFLYFTTDAEVARRAELELTSAGILCSEPQSYPSEVRTESTTALARWLRAEADEKKRIAVSVARTYGDGDVRAQATERDAQKFNEWAQLVEAQVTKESR